MDITPDILRSILGHLLSYLSSIKLTNKNARKKSNRKLRESFSGEQAFMEDMKDPSRKKGGLQNDVYPRLNGAIEKQGKTVIEHMHYLSDDDKHALKIAWDKYKFGVRCHEYKFRGTKGDAPKEIFDERVAAILKFAAD